MTSKIIQHTKYLGGNIEYPCEQEGTLIITTETVIFEAPNFDLIPMKIPIDKIEDAKVVTEKEISALRVFLFGAVFGTLFKKTSKAFEIDFRDSHGILQHLIFQFEDNFDIENLEMLLYNYRKNKK